MLIASISSSNFLILSSSGASKVKGLSLLSLKYLNTSGSCVAIRNPVISVGSRLQGAIIWHSRAFVTPASAGGSSYVAFGLSFKYSTNLKPVRTGLDGSRPSRNDRTQTLGHLPIFKNVSYGRSSAMAVVR